MNCPRTLIGFTAFLSFSACAPVYRYPCEFDLRVKVMDAAGANDECHGLGAVDHQGQRVPRSRRINGCAPGDAIITRANAATAGHEIMHHVDRKCRIK